MEVKIRQFREGDAAEFTAAVLESADNIAPWLP